jgi:hypothetical protein
MKTTTRKEALPSPLRLIIYMVLIAAICFLNCLSLEAKSRSGDTVAKGNFEIINVNLPVAQYSLPQWLIGVYLDIVLQPILEQYGSEASEYQMQLARTNELSNLRSLSTGTTMVFPTFDKSSE